MIRMRNNESVEWGGILDFFGVVSMGREFSRCSGCVLSLGREDRIAGGVRLCFVYQPISTISISDWSIEKLREITYLKNVS